jgi:hypothetical protein
MAKHVPKRKDFNQEEFNPDETRAVLFQGKREEITDLVDGIKAQYTPENFAKLDLKKGKMLRFLNDEGVKTNIKITRKSKDRYWGEHIVMEDMNIVRSHTRHHVDVSQKPPFCFDCQVPVTEPSTEDGEKKYKDRKDRHLSDGTPIDPDTEQ